MNLDHLAELEAKATPGPWGWLTGPAHHPLPDALVGGNETNGIGVMEGKLPTNPADAALIAAARNALPALIECARALHELAYESGECPAVYVRIHLPQGDEGWIEDCPSTVCFARRTLALLEQPQDAATDVGEGGDGLRGYDGGGSLA